MSRLTKTEVLDLIKKRMRHLIKEKMKEENPGTVDEFIKGLDKEVPESSQIADHNKRLENMLKNPEKEHM